MLLYFSVFYNVIVFLSLVLQMNISIDFLQLLVVFIVADAQFYGISKYQFHPARPRPNMPFPRSRLVDRRIIPFPRSHPVVPHPRPPTPRAGPAVHPHPTPRAGPGGYGPPPCTQLDYNGCYGPYGNGRRVFDRDKWNYISYWQDGPSMLGASAYQPRSYISNQPSFPRPYPRSAWTRNYQMNFVPYTYLNRNLGQFGMTHYGGNARNFDGGHYFRGGRHFGGGRYFGRGPRRRFSGSGRYDAAGFFGGYDEFGNLGYNGFGRSGYGGIRYGGAFGSSGQNLYPIFRIRRRGHNGRRGYYYIEHDNDED